MMNDPRDHMLNQPGRAPNQPDDITNYLMGRIFAAIGSVFVNGFPFSGRFKKSLRVGSGAATLAAFDGNDGRVLSDGTLAGFIARDRADSTKYLVLYKNGTIRLSSQAGDLWLIDDTTGIITPSVTAISSFTNSWVNFGNSNDAKYWKDIHGVVHLEGTIKSGVIGSAAFTLPSGFRPLANKGYACASNGAYGELSITASTGAVTPAVGSNVYFTLDGVSFRTL